MKKNVFGRKFKRDANERKALFKNLLTSLVLKERIKTTEAKAKAIKSAADKLVTKAKKAKSTDKAGSEKAYKHIHPDVNQEAVVKLIEDIGPRFAKRQGGYTRIIKVGKRRVADNAEMVILEWTESAAGANLELRTSTSAKATADKKNLKQTKKAKVVKDNKKGKIEVEEAGSIVSTKPIITKKEEKIQKPGIFKRLITRQKKGQ